MLFSEQPIRHGVQTHSEERHDLPTATTPVRSGRTGLVLWTVGAACLLGALLWRSGLPATQVRTSYGLAMAIGAATIAVGAVRARLRRVPHGRAWLAFGLGLGAAMGGGAWETLAVPEGSHPGHLIVLAVGVPLVAGSLPILIGLSRARLDGVLDSVMVAGAGMLWAWELQFQPTITDALDRAHLIPLAFVGLCSAMATVALLTGTHGRISRTSWLMSAGFGMQAAAIVVLPDTLAGRPYAHSGVGTGMMILGVLPLVAAVWVAAANRPQVVTPRPRVLRWWAPAALAVGSWVLQTVVGDHLDGLPGDRFEQGLTVVVGTTLVTRVVLMVRSEEKAMGALESQRQRLETLLGDAQDHVVLVDEAFVVRDQLTFPAAVTPAAPKDLTGVCLLDRLHPEDAALMRRGRLLAAAQPGISHRQELRLADPDRVVWIEGTIADHTDDPLIGCLVVTFRDITDRRLAEDELFRQARIDELTDLPNRNAVRTEAETQLLGASAAHPVALLYADLDRLKVVNDSLGHHLGDQVIVAVARRWAQLIGNRGTVGRVGGDEFVIVLPDPTDVDPMATAQQMIDALEQPLDLQGLALTVTASIGVATVVDPSTTVDEGLRDADAALYVAKNDGGNRARAFDPAMHAAAVERLRLEQELRVALRDGTIDIHLQPLVDLPTETPVSFEALVRWHLAGSGMVPADRLIAMAEETGLIVPLGDHVLRRACDAIHRIRTEVGLPVSVAVNTSVIQLLQPAFVSTVLTTLAETNLPAEALVLEVTESLLLDEDGVALSALTALRHAGVGVSLDDFGTGYSSLSHLGTFPLDELKLDRRLVATANDSVAGAAVLGGIVRIAETIGLRVVAEGLEVAADAQRVRAAGVQLGQGWHFARPMPVEDAVAWLRARFPTARRGRHVADLAPVADGGA